MGWCEKYKVLQQGISESELCSNNNDNNNKNNIRVQKNNIFLSNQTLIFPDVSTARRPSFSRVMIIIIITLFQEDNIFGTNVSLTYGPQLQMVRLSLQILKNLGEIYLFGTIQKAHYPFQKISRLHNLDIMRQIAYLNVNPIMADSYVFRYNCMAGVRASDPMTTST